MLYACAAAGAAGYLWLKQTSKQAASKAPTDFDSFLLAPALAAQPSKSAHTATSFESFLKVQPAPPSSTDFASFLINIPGAAAAGSQPEAVDAAAACVDDQVPEDEVPVAVLYGTEYGFAREIAEKLCEQLKGTGKFW